MMTFVVANKKGGVGKTTTAFNLAEGLRLRGKNVLLIDLDGQANLTRMTGVKLEHTSTSFGVLTHEVTEIWDAITYMGPESCAIMPASPALATADQTFPPGIGRNMRLKEALQEFGDTYDFCVIDTPPSIGVITVNALVAADFVIIPAEANELSTDGIISIYESVCDVRKYANPQLEISGILLTRYRGNTSIAKQYLEIFKDVARKMHTTVYKTPIRESIIFSEIPSVHESVFEYKPRSNAAKDYGKLVDEAIGIAHEKDLILELSRKQHEEKAKRDAEAYTLLNEKEKKEKEERKKREEQATAALHETLNQIFKVDDDKGANNG